MPKGSLAGLGNPAYRRVGKPALAGNENCCEKSWLLPPHWYRYHVAGYRRPLSQNELRQIRREKRRVFFWCALVIMFATAGVAGLIYLLYKSPHL